MLGEIRTEEDVKSKIVENVLRKIHEQVYYELVGEVAGEKRCYVEENLGVFDKVAGYEWRLGSGRADIVLFGGIMVVEVKKPGEYLDKYVEQAKKYVEQITRYVILTNGYEWKIYRAQDGRMNTKNIYGCVRLSKDDVEAIRNGDVERIPGKLVAVYRDAMRTATNLYYKATPKNFIKAYIGITKYIDILRKHIKKITHNNKYRIFYDVYKSYMERVYGGGEISEEKIEELYIRHSLMQMILNAIFNKITGKKCEKVNKVEKENEKERKNDLIRCIMKYITEVRYPAISLPFLMWFKKYYENECRDSRDELCGVLEEIARKIVSKTEMFDWSMPTDIDVFREFYEKFIEQEDRRRIGEYYTPWWLAEFIVEKVAEKLGGLEGKYVLDPACGSGTFLVASLYRKVAEGESPDDAIKEVYGFDINPVAVSIARLELMIAYMRIKKKKIIDIDNEKEIITPLVFWGDTAVYFGRIGGSAEAKDIIWVLEGKIDTKARGIRNQRDEVIGVLKNLLWFENVLKNVLKEIDEAVENGKSGAEIKEEVRKMLGDVVAKSGNDVIMAKMVRVVMDGAVLDEIIRLVSEQRDGMWSGYISSVLGRAVIEGAGAFDAVVSNPPWLLLSKLPKKINRKGEWARTLWSEKLVEEIKEKYGYYFKNWGVSMRIGGMDISSWFLHRALMYVRRGGVVGFVMPFTAVVDPIGSSHGYGKILTYGVLKKYGCSGDIYYVANDVFGHGKNPVLVIVRRG